MEATIRTKKGLRARQSGIGLIEVLLAVIIMSIGFLAAARMQIEGMSASQNAYALSQAKLMVQDMSERMRANRQGLAAGNYTNLSTAANTAAPGCLTSGTACTPAQRAQGDAYAWRELLHPSAAGATPLLPSADGITASGSVTFVDDTYVVTATWAERVGGEPESRSYSVRVVP